MKGWKTMAVALVVTGLTAAPVSAQSSMIERTLDRLGRTIERVVDNVGGAFEGETAWSRAAEDFEWTGDVPRGGVVEVKGINGSIHVERTSSSQLTISAEVRARRSDPETVRVELVEHGDGLTFCAVYPTPENAERENSCQPGSRGQMNTNNNDVQVTFYVQLPEGVPFAGRTVNGGIEAVDLESDVELVTVNGDVEVSTTGFASAETVNGSIDAEIGSIHPEQGVEFSTVNGSIELDVPDGIDADLDASWLNGGFESDLPVGIRGRVSRRSARGALGDGGAELQLETVNGSIRIR